MRPASLLAVTLFLLGACVPLAVAAGPHAAMALRGGEAPDERCEDVPLRPFPDVHDALEGAVIAHFTNEGEAATARLCLFDASGAKRADYVLDMAAGETRDIVVAAPPGVYTFRSEASWEGHARGGSTTSKSTLSTLWCLSRSGDVHLTFHVGPIGAGGSAFGGDCIPAPLVIGLVGLAASGGAFAFAQFPVGVAMLYTRLAGPRVLDHALRARILALVQAQPGIHTRELTRALGVGDGQTAHHLAVLAREKHLLSTGSLAMRHWFVAGRHDAAEMRALISLRDATRRRVYDAIVADRDATLSAVATAAGVSLPQASRAAQALERAGLVERRASGRSVRLRATGAS